MLKYRKPLWYFVLSLGAAAALAGAAFLLLFALTHRLSWINGIVLSLILLGGIAVGFFALRTLRLLKEIALHNSAGSNREKKQAQESLSRLYSSLEQRFSKVLALTILLISGFVFLLFYSLANPGAGSEAVEAITGVVCERGKVVSVDSESYRGSQEMEDMPVGNQIVTVELSSGSFKGSRYQMKNDLGVLYGTVLDVGDGVIVAMSLEEGQLSSSMIWSFDRTLPLLIVFGAFLLITVLVGGKIGAKSLLGLLLTFVCFFSVLIPLLLKGWPTLMSIMGMCVFITVVEFTILDGVNKKSVCAMLGTISGVVLAMVFAQIAGAVLRVNGFIMNDAEPAVEALVNHKTLQDPLHSLQIKDLLVGGILIAALGAVNDVAMSISSAMKELITVNPELTRKELLKSGMNIGRDMVGTMTNTLILALAGSSLVSMIYYTSLGPTWNELMSSAFLAIEIVQALASSIGVILAVPVTVLIGMLMYGHSAKKPARAKA
ncbi:MAG: YibE/F family protein [Oscillospiraceae bacterium]|nr:YibE/F family protein [Oscillospiraceae bacterium]